MLNGAEFAKLLNIEDNTKEIIRIIEASKWMEVTLDILEENNKLKEELQLKDKVIKRAIERCKREIEVLDELLKEEYEAYGRSSEYELYSEQLDTIIDIKEKLENK